jgi:hypothetical protein
MWWTAIICNGENYEALEFLDGPEPADAYEHIRKVTECDGNIVVAILKGTMSSGCWGTQSGKLTSPPKNNSNRKRPAC